MRASFIIISLFIIMAKSLSIYLKILNQKIGESQIFAIIACFINLVDLVCELYFSLIWVADLIFNDTFITNDLKWRGNALCFSAFTLSFLFNLFMPFILTYLSLARAMVVIYPLNLKFKQKRFVLRGLLHIVYNSYSMYSNHSYTNSYGSQKKENTIQLMFTIH